MRRAGDVAGASAAMRVGCRLMHGAARELDARALAAGVARAAVNGALGRAEEAGAVPQWAIWARDARELAMRGLQEAAEWLAAAGAAPEELRAVLAEATAANQERFGQ